MGFDPVTLTALAVGGAGLTAFGKLESGNAASEAANYQAQVYQNNQTIANQNADWAEQAGSAKEAAQGMRTAATVGSIKAKQAASGVDVNTGSNKDVTSAAADLGKLDALTIRSNTAREAYGFEVQATSAGAQAGLSQMEASHDTEAGDIGAASSLISGASSAFGKYAQWQNVGGTYQNTG